MYLLTHKGNYDRLDLLASANNLLANPVSCNIKHLSSLNNISIEIRFKRAHVVVHPIDFIGNLSDRVTLNRRRHHSQTFFGSTSAVVLVRCTNYRTCTSQLEIGLQIPK